MQCGRHTRVRVCEARSPSPQCRVNLSNISLVYSLNCCSLLAVYAVAVAAGSWLVAPHFAKFRLATRMLALYLAGGLAASPRLQDTLASHERLNQAVAKEEGGPLEGKCKALQAGITDEWCETNYAGFPAFCKCEGVSASAPADTPSVPDTLPTTETTPSQQQPAPEAAQPAPVPEPAAVASQAGVPSEVGVPEVTIGSEPGVPEVTVGSNDVAAPPVVTEIASMCGSQEMDDYFNNKCGNSVASIIAECCDEHMDDEKCDSFRLACIKGHIEAGECKDPFACDDGCQFYDGVASTCCPHVRARKLAVAPSKQVDWATGAEIPQAPADEAAVRATIAAAEAANTAAAQAAAQAAPEPKAVVDPVAAAKAATHDAAQVNAQAAAATKGANAQAIAAAGGAAPKQGEPSQPVDWATGAPLPQAPAAEYDAAIDESTVRETMAAAEAANAAASDTIAANVPMTTKKERVAEDADPDGEFNPNNPASDGAPHQRPAPTQTPDDYCGSPAHAAHFDELCGGKLLDIMADCCTVSCIYDWKCAKACDRHRAACSQAQVVMGVCTDKDDCDMGTQIFNQVTDSCCVRDPPPVPPPSPPPPYRVCERHDRRKREGERHLLDAAPILAS